MAKAKTKSKAKFAVEGTYSTYTYEGSTPEAAITKAFQMGEVELGETVNVYKLDGRYKIEETNITVKKVK